MKSKLDKYRHKTLGMTLTFSLLVNTNIYFHSNHLKVEIGL